MKMAEKDNMPDTAATDERLARQLGAHHARRFAPGFADRVMIRVREEAVADAAEMSGIAAFAATMSVMFRRLTVPAAALCLLLAAYNVTVSQSSAYGPPEDFIDAIFALVPTGADSALSL
jgi:Arc/MetJ family transcription regulator